MEDIDDIWKSVTSASVCDALGRICNHRAHVLDLVSPTPGKVRVVSYSGAAFHGHDKGNRGLALLT